MGTEASRVASVTTDEDTSALRAGLSAGDSQAHQELCTRYGRDLHRYLAARLGDDDLAEELMVQTLADGVRHITRFSPRISTLRAWLFGIARRHLRGNAAGARAPRGAPPGPARSARSPRPGAPRAPSTSRSGGPGERRAGGLAG